MANILYVTNDDFDESAGGMGTKTQAIKAAWETNTGHTVSVGNALGIEDAEADVIILELLGINNFDRIAELSGELKKHAAPVFVYGSDSEIFRWPGAAIDTLKIGVTGWIANCEWQKNYFNDFRLPVYGIVREPIDCDLFRPARNRDDVLLAGGQISYGKHSEFFIELFENLTDPETAYIGSASGWGKRSADHLSLILEHKMEVVAGTFHGQKPPHKVADIMSNARFFVVNSHYETCNRMGMEAHAAGLDIIAGPHICFDEWPNAFRFTTLQECVDLIKNFQDAESKSVENIRFAKETWSYEASLKQLDAILRRVL